MGTEDVSPRYRDIDLWPPADVVDAIVDAQLAAVAAVRAVGPAIGDAVAAAVARLGAGEGRLVYVGAGASGRLAVQDGVELPPTYGWPHERLMYLMAGGDTALVRSVEGAEDDTAAPGEAFERAGVGSADVVVAVAASGRTPYAVAAVDAARRLGALTVALANNAASPLLASADHPILLQTGPEVVAGSTRMAAGTAQKVALNAFSTALMVGLNRTWSNLMVDVAASNAKLDRRRVRLLQRIVPVDDDRASALLQAAGGHVKTAALLAAGDDAESAAARLHRHGGNLRRALAECPLTI
ncbi:MAG: N-acetylmuramic acid 6-phosphate etherase [Pseudomonadota bacterium]